MNQKIKTGVSVQPHKAVDEVNRTVELQPEGPDDTTVGWAVSTHWSDGSISVLSRRGTEIEATFVAEAYSKEAKIPVLKPTWKGTEKVEFETDPLLAGFNKAREFPTLETLRQWDRDSTHRDYFNVWAVSTSGDPAARYRGRKQYDTDCAETLSGQPVSRLDYKPNQEVAAVTKKWLARAGLPAPINMQNLGRLSSLVDLEIFGSTTANKNNKHLVIQRGRHRKSDPNYHPMYQIAQEPFMNDNIKEVIEDRKANWPVTSHLELKEGSVIAVELAAVKYSIPANTSFGAVPTQVDLEVQPGGADEDTVAHAVYLRLQDGSVKHVIDCKDGPTAVTAVQRLCARFLVPFELPEWMVPLVNPEPKPVTLGTLLNERMAERPDSFSISRPTQEEMEKVLSDPRELAAIERVRSHSAAMAVDQMLAAAEDLEPVVIDSNYLQELTDRVHCMNHSFEELIADHAAASLVLPDIQAVRQAVNDLYQAIGTLMHEYAEKEEAQTGPIDDGFDDVVVELNNLAALISGAVDGTVPVSLIDPNKPFSFGDSPIYYKMGDLMIGIKIEGPGTAETDGNLEEEPNRAVTFVLDYKDDGRFDAVNQNSYNTSAIMDLYETIDESAPKYVRLNNLIACLQAAK